MRRITFHAYKLQSTNTMDPQTQPQPQMQTQTQIQPQTRQNDQELTRQSRSNELMPPPPPPKRIKRPSTVLDEDIYITALSDIIARDFFPRVAQARAEESELQSLSLSSSPWGATKQDRKFRQQQRQRQWQGDETPAGWGGETPATIATEDGFGSDAGSEAGTEAGIHSQTPDISGMSLLAFQAKYTSEDNESFNKLLDRQNTSRRQKYAWLWAGGNRKKAEESQKKITGSDTGAGGAAQNRITEKGEDDDDDGNGNGNGNNQLIKTNLDARPANPTTWNAPPENSLMFMPDSVEDTHETIAQRAELESRMGPKRVLYHNTRLPDKPPSSQNHPPPQSPSLSAIQDAIAGNPRLSASEAGSAVYTGGETPRVNGYAFVDDEEDDSYTNSDNSSSNTTPNPFTIPQNRRREDLHHRMVDRMSRSKRVERSSGSVSGSGSGSGSGKALTPAAQKLLKRVGNTPRTDTRGGSGSGNMWTPTPKTANSNKWTPTPRRR